MEEQLILYVRYTAKPGCRESFVRDIVEEGILTQIRQEDGVFFVEAPWLLRLMRGINFDDSESLQYFEKVLRSAGVIDALTAAGVAEGDTVCIYDFEFEFVY